MSFGFPFFKFRNYPIGKPQFHPNTIKDTHSVHTQDITAMHENGDNFNHNSKQSNNINDFFDVFGVRLYYDDILLISLIFFLYSEGVDDSSLFIALILLLLS